MIIFQNITNWCFFLAKNSLLLPSYVKRFIIFVIMELPEDYKNIVKLRFNESDKLGNHFFETFYNGIKDPETFNGDIFKKMALGDILQYLKNSHTEYLTLWFPKIENLAKELQKEIGINDLTLTLHSFVVNYFWVKLVD